jgi:hypothetical protein
VAGVTAAGLIVTGIVLALVLARELVRLRADGSAQQGRSHLDTAIPPALVAWAGLVIARLADYLG